MLFDSLDKIKRNSIMSSILLTALGSTILICPDEYVESLIFLFGYSLVIFAIVLFLNFFSSNKSLMEYLKFVGSCILATVDLQPKTSNGIPLIAMIGIVFSIALAIYSVTKLTTKKTVT